MSSQSRRSRRRSTAIQRLNGKSWLRRYFRALRNGVAVASLGTIGLLSQPAYGANNLWIGNTSVNWNDPTNWSTNPTGPLTGDTLEFNLAGTAGVTIVDNLMTPGTYSVAGITFDPTAAAFIVNPADAATNGFTLTGNITNNATATETINDPITTTAVRTVTSAAGSNLVLGGGVGGAGGGILTAGPGTLTLSGVNNYTGTTTVSAGTLNLSGSLGQTTAAGAITVGNTANVNAILKISANVTSSSNIVFGGTLNGNANGANAVGAGYQTGAYSMPRPAPT